MPTSIIYISFSKSFGGASKAAGRFLRLLNDNPAYSTSWLTQDAVPAHYKILRRLCYLLGRTEFSDDPGKRSLNLFSMPSLWNIQKFHGICHIHWINNDTLSIFSFSKIPPYSIITLHDEWIYCSSEHTYPLNTKTAEFVQGYGIKHRQTRGIPWSYLVWKTKIKAFQSRPDLTFTVPSTWMLDRARASQVLKNSRVLLLPNPIDTDNYQPVSSARKRDFRQQMGVRDHCKLIVAGNFLHEVIDKLKGSDHLLRLLADPDLNLPNIQFVFFGGLESGKRTVGKQEVIFQGHVDSDTTLCALYSSADIVLFPSLVESFGQIPAEALACGTPVVCFETSGLNDLVINNTNGFTAPCDSYDALKGALLQAIESPDETLASLGLAGREHIVNHCSNAVIRAQYVQLLENASAQRVSEASGGTQDKNTSERTTDS